MISGGSKGNEGGRARSVCPSSLASCPRLRSVPSTNSAAATHVQHCSLSRRGHPACSSAMARALPQHPSLRDLQALWAQLDELGGAPSPATPGAAAAAAHEPPPPGLQGPPAQPEQPERPAAPRPSAGPTWQRTLQRHSLQRRSLSVHGGLRLGAGVSEAAAPPPPPRPLPPHDDATAATLQRRCAKALALLQELQAPGAAGHKPRLPGAALRYCAGVAFVFRKKAGLLLSGCTWGHALVLARLPPAAPGQQQRWSAPVFLRISGGSLGLSVGGSSTRALCVLQVTSALFLRVGQKGANGGMAARCVLCQPPHAHLFPSTPPTANARCPCLPACAPADGGAAGGACARRRERRRGGIPARRTGS